MKGVFSALAGWLRGRTLREADVLGDGQSHRQLGRGDTEWGVVGWEGDQSTQDVVELGDGSDGPDGRTLVHVTLYAGRDITRRPEKGKAQGRQVYAQIGGPLFAVPPIGTQVVITFPGGDQETPGNGIITIWAQRSPTQQFKSSRMVLDAGADFDLVLKGRSVTLMDHGKDETPERFACWLAVGPVAGGTPTISCNDPTGSGWTVGNGVVGIFATDSASPPAAKAFIQVKADAFGFGIDGAGFAKLDDAGKMTIGASKAISIVGAQVLLGAAATATTAVCATTPGGSGASGVGSTCVFVSP